MTEKNKNTTPETGRPYPTQKEKLDEITTSIEQGITDLFNSENYKNYLSVMSKFHRYSTNNCMLIYMQNPNATRVASFKSWNDNFNRHVMAKEKGIKIIAPAPYTKIVEVEKKDPSTGKTIFDGNGSPVMEQKKITMPGFRVATVFDISQTEGEPLPELVHALNGNVENYKVLLEAIQKSSPVPINFKKLPDNVDGYFSHSDQEITIRNDMSEKQTICALIHEISHAMLHNYDKQSEVKKDRNVKEIEAESVAYSVCKYLGIDTDENSLGYIAGWSKDQDIKVLRESLDTINETASTLISSIENEYAELELNPIEQISTIFASIGSNEADIDGFNNEKKFAQSCLALGKTNTLFNEFHKKITVDSDAKIVDSFIEKLNKYKRDCCESMLFQIKEDLYFHAQLSDDNFNVDYTMYRYDNYQLFDGGVTDFEPGDKNAENDIFDMALLIAETYGYREADIKLAENITLDEIIECPPSVNLNPMYKVCDPSPELTEEDLNNYGYTNGDMLPLTRERAKQLLDDGCPISILTSDNTSILANNYNDIDNCICMLGIEKGAWLNAAHRVWGIDAQQEKEESFLTGDKDGFGIYQLKLTEENRDLLFENILYLKAHNMTVDAERYQFVYCGDNPDHFIDSPLSRKLDEIYDRLNINRPVDYTTRSLSVGDVIALKENGQISYHFVDSIGFKEIPDFIPEKIKNIAKENNETKSEASRVSVIDKLAEMKKQLNNDHCSLNNIDKEVLE